MISPNCTPRLLLLIATGLVPLVSWASCKIPVSTYAPGLVADVQVIVLRETLGELVGRIEDRCREAYQAPETTIAHGAETALKALKAVTHDWENVSVELSDNGQYTLRIARLRTNRATVEEDELVAQFLFVLAFGLFDPPPRGCVIAERDGLLKNMLILEAQASMGKRPVLHAVRDYLQWRPEVLVGQLPTMHPREFVRYVVRNCPVYR